MEGKSLVSINDKMGILDVKAQVQSIHKIMREIMIKDVHYGVIPGTKKATLYKPGAEKILMAFRISCFSEIEDLSNEDEARYRVKITAKHIGTDKILGTAFGECSSNEEKYKWRVAVCDEEFESFPENKKRLKFKKGFNNSAHQKIKQIRTEKADIANTILKMADKRAYIAITLKCTAASDVFDQDLEDLPNELIQQSKITKPQVPMPQPKTNSNNNTNYACSNCGVVIDEKVYKYSMNVKKKALCYDCQKNA